MLVASESVALENELQTVSRWHGNGYSWLIFSTSISRLISGPEASVTDGRSQRENVFLSLF